ncbi:uncharacterized protein LOC135577421 [Columba livia]|uniref:uncharacterized protein LOC135577421 n=1 Tax=Columba livia TaxID=8932 RepID=UPI0031BA9E7E
MSGTTQPQPLFTDALRQRPRCHHLDMETQHTNTLGEGVWSSKGTWARTDIESRWKDREAFAPVTTWQDPEGCLILEGADVPGATLEAEETQEDVTMPAGLSGPKNPCRPCTLSRRASRPTCPMSRVKIAGKEIITLKKKRLFTILILMLAGALAGVCCGSLMLMLRLWTQDAPQVLLGQPAADLLSLRNTMALGGEQSQEMKQLRDELVRLAAEISATMKEVQQMRDAMSATTQLSDWALKSAGAAIDLQRSSSRCTGFSSVFWFLCDPPELGTFVQVE